MRPAVPAAVCLGALTLAVAAAAGTERVERTFAVDGATTGVVVEDHRVPLAWMVVDLPVGTASVRGRGLPLEEAWRVQLRDPDGVLRRRSDRLAAGLSLVVGERSCSLRASCLVDDLPQVAALVRDVLANRSFDAGDLRRWRKERRITWDASLKEPWFRLDRAVARLLFEEGDARRDAWEEPDKVVTDTAVLLEVRDAVLATPGRIVGFAGAVTVEQAKALAAGLLPETNAVSPGELGPRLRRPVPLARREPEAVTVPRMKQVVFALARVSPAVGDPGYPAFLVADHVLGGHFYSRLSVALRHREGDTYGASTRRGDGTVPWAYTLATFTGADHAADAEAKLRAVLETLHRDGITEPERSAAVGFLTGRIAFARQSPLQDLLRGIHERRWGLPTGELDRAARDTAGVSLEQVNAFIADFYDPSRFRLVTVGPPR